MSLTTCPLCAYSDENEYALALHVEVVHFSSDSPFVVRNSGFQSVTEYNDDSEDADKKQNSRSDDWVLCVEDGCSEQVLWTEMQEHLDLHLAENLNLEDEVHNVNDLPICGSDVKMTETQYTGENQADDMSNKLALERHRNVSKYQNSSIGPSPQDIRRLGKRELGPYAYELRMPKSLYDQLLKGGKKTVVQRISPETGSLYRDVTFENEISGMIPLLGFLLNNDLEVRCAYLCHGAVQHVFKTAYEGGFCGYRNAQMMISFIQGSDWRGVENLSNNNKKEAKSEILIPNIIALQDMIEEAWDKGYNSYARVETGGIRATRKYIGTSEVQALFESMKISTRVSIFSDRKDIDVESRERRLASEQLLDAIEKYFMISQNASSSSLHNHPEHNSETKKVNFTSLPPIYLQQPGHSLTIVGIEILRDGKRGLIVLDPAYRTSPAVMKLLRQRNAVGNATASPFLPLNNKSPKSSTLHNLHAVGTAATPAPIKTISAFAAKALGVAPPSSYGYSMSQQQQPTVGKKRSRPTSSGSASSLEPSPDRQKHDFGDSGCNMITEADSLSSRTASTSTVKTHSPILAKSLKSKLMDSINPETATKLLYAYRRRRRRLARFSEFEILMLRPLF